MTRYLMFTLHGPMQSWGGIAVGEVRDSQRHPSKSGVLGLAAAAMGIPRHNDAVHRDLAAGIAFAVWIARAGTLLRDYHTVQVPPATKRGPRFPTRAEELAAPRLNTILSTRDYLTDAVFVVALWERDGYDLEPLRRALLKPVFTPYLGRKSCPPALPIFPVWREADTLEQAFAAYRIPEVLRVKSRGREIYFEPDATTTLEITHRGTRWDAPLSRARWTFQPREERQAYLKEES